MTFWTSYSPVLVGVMIAAMMLVLFQQVWILTVVFFVFTVITFCIYYRVENDRLLIYIGPFRTKSVNIANIKSIVKTNTVLSAPAASVRDRIKVRSEFEMPVVISPKERNAFLEALLEVDPSIQIDEHVWKMDDWSG